MQRITYVGVVSLAKITGLITMIMGTAISLIYGLMFLAMIALGMGANAGRGMPGSMELGVIVIAMMVMVPFLYGLLGFAMGAFYALVLNFVFRFTGGLEVRIRAD